MRQYSLRATASPAIGQRASAALSAIGHKLASVARPAISHQLTKACKLMACGRIAPPAIGRKLTSLYLQRRQQATFLHAWFRSGPACQICS